MSQTPGSGDRVTYCLLGPLCALCWWRRVGAMVTPLSAAEVRRMFRRDGDDA